MTIPQEAIDVYGEERARLIDAAPDLLDACKGLMGLMQLICARPDMPQEIRQAVQDNHRWRAANDAVAKASE